MMDERGDFLVVHEPFSHLMDFGSVEVDGVRCSDEESLIETLLGLAERTALFVKDTTDFHYPGVLASERFLTSATHTFIVRRPSEAIASHYRLNPHLSRDEIGFAWVRELHDAVEQAGNRTVVIDADDLVDQPEATVKAYCQAVGIPFLPGALSWPAKVLPGWQRTLRWHADVAASEGIQRIDESGSSADSTAPDIAGHPVLGPYYRYHLPHYLWLQDQRLRPDPSSS